MPTLKELAIQRMQLVARINELKKELEPVEHGINEIIAPIANAARQTEGKDTGTVNVEIEGMQVKADLPKKVDWDQEALSAIGDKIAAAGDDPVKYIRVTYGVSETAFKQWPDAVKAVFLPARTVKTGKPVYTVVLDEDIPF